MLKAIIFDMDGVIIDSEPLHVEVEKELAEKLGGKLDDELHEKLVGTTDYAMWSKLKDMFDFKLSVDEIVEIKKDMFIERFDEVQLMDNFRPLVSSLYDEGYPMAVASSNNRKIVDMIIDRFDLSKYMTFVISGEEVEKGKPDPEIFLTAAKKMNVKPEDCLVIEDAANGVKAAKDAGMICVGLKDIDHGNQDLSDADLIINNLNELDLNTMKNLFKTFI